MARGINKVILVGNRGADPESRTRLPTRITLLIPLKSFSKAIPYYTTPQNRGAILCRLPMNAGAFAGATAYNDRPGLARSRDEDY